MLSLWACLVDKTYIKNTATLVEGSVWTERFSSSLIQETANEEFFKKRLQKLAQGELAKFLFSEPEPELPDIPEDSDAESEEPEPRNLGAPKTDAPKTDAPKTDAPKTGHNVPDRTRPQGVSADQKKPYFDITRDKTSQMPTVGRRGAPSIEEALVEKFIKEGITLVSI